MKGRFGTVIEYSVALGMMGLAWWVASDLMGMPRYLLPSPQVTFLSLWRTSLSGELLPHFWFTLQNLLLGLGVGAVTGVAAAYGLYKAPRLATYLEGPLVFFQSAPKIALAPLFVVWFGLGLTSKIVLVVSLVFFPILVGALAGFRGIDSRMNDLAVLLQLRAFQRFWNIDLIAAMPAIFVGLKIGAVQALVGAVLAEWISGNQGLGYLMTFASATFNTPLLFGTVLLTSFLGISLHAALTSIEAGTLAWKMSDGR